ncbi:MAG: type I-E CRISPR-associated protein Cas6/Cse3/CasE [Hyphomicrobiaceae bacterium]
MTATLNLLHLPVDLRALARFAADRNRGQITYARKGREHDAGLDEGRALHHLLDETFGPASLRPFRLMSAPGARAGSVYAYSRCTEEALKTAIRETSMPEAAHVLGLDRISTREVPSDWPSGRRLAFDVRVRPVVRIRGDLPNPRDPQRPYKAGSELDAYFVEAQRRFPDERPTVAEGNAAPSGMERAGRTRDTVYFDWLATRLDTAADIDLTTTTLHQYQRTRVARQGYAPEGPDATLHGELVVKNETAFHAALADGVGRHRSYGFGMLLLRPARRRNEEAF